MKSEAPYNPLAANDHRRVYFLTGLVLILAMIHLAFNWRGPDSNSVSISDNGEDIFFMEEDELIPRTTTARKMSPPPVAVTPSPIIPSPIVPSILPIDPDPYPVFDPSDVDMNLIDGGDVPDPDLTMKDPNKVFTFLEKRPKFPGNLDDYLRKNLRYPNIAKEYGIEGTVQVSFIIEKDGSLSNIKIEKGLGYGLDEEVKRVLAMCPKWEPGIQNENPVRFQYGKNVKFVLNR